MSERTYIDFADKLSAEQLRTVINFARKNHNSTKQRKMFAKYMDEHKEFNQMLNGLAHELYATDALSIRSLDRLEALTSTIGGYNLIREFAGVE